jgi:murein L,D-transpeptidase YafK
MALMFVKMAAYQTNLPTTSSSNKNKDAELIAFANDWANAWSAKDIDLYLSKYAQDFKTPNGDAFSLWQTSRRQKISSQGKILVEIEDLKLSIKTDNSARIQFKQKYTSDRLTEMSNKSLVVKKLMAAG